MKILTAAFFRLTDIFFGGKKTFCIIALIIHLKKTEERIG